MSDLRGKVAIVTGGGGVLGGNISDSLVKAGVKVAVSYTHLTLPTTNFV